MKPGIVFLISTVVVIVVVVGVGDVIIDDDDDDNDDDDNTIGFDLVILRLLVKDNAASLAIRGEVDIYKDEDDDDDDEDEDEDKKRGECSVLDDTINPVTSIFMDRLRNIRNIKHLKDIVK